MPRVTLTAPGQNAQPYRFQLDRRVVTMGRGGDNDILIDCGSVSAHHAEMRRIEGGYELVDIGSTNGITLDGVRYEVIPLKNGASIKLGDVAFDFLLAEDELGALSREQRRVELPLASPPVNEDAPQDLAARRIAQQRAAIVLQRSSGLGAGAIVMFLILAAAAFFAGLAIRYQKETDASLIHSMQMKFGMKRTIEVKPEPAKSSN